MAEDRAVRKNRIALLQTIAALFMGVADLSEIAAPAAAAPGARRARGTPGSEA
jgi:hypothetical protein